MSGSLQSHGWKIPSHKTDEKSKKYTIPERYRKLNEKCDRSCLNCFHDLKRARFCKRY